MLNHVTLQGRITRDPELKTTTNSVSTCSFTLAVDRSFVRPGEERKTDFINCVAWRQTAEFITRYFKKGEQLIVEGSIQVRSWDKDGKKQYSTEVVVDRVHFSGRQETQSTLGATTGEPIALTGSEEDLLF